MTATPDHPWCHNDFHVTVHSFSRSRLSTPTCTKTNQGSEVGSFNRLRLCFRNCVQAELGPTCGVWLPELLCAGPFCEFKCPCVSPIQKKKTHWKICKHSNTRVGVRRVESDKAARDYFACLPESLTDEEDTEVAAWFSIQSPEFWTPTPTAHLHHSASPPSPTSLLAHQHHMRSQITKSSNNLKNTHKHHTQPNAQKGTTAAHCLCLLRACATWSSCVYDSPMMRSSSSESCDNRRASNCQSVWIVWVIVEEGVSGAPWRIRQDQSHQCWKRVNPINNESCIFWTSGWRLRWFFLNLWPLARVRRQIFTRTLGWSELLSASSAASVTHFRGPDAKGAASVLVCFCGKVTAQRVTSASSCVPRGFAMRGNSVPCGTKLVFDALKRGFHQAQQQSDRRFVTRISVWFRFHATCSGVRFSGIDVMSVKALKSRCFVRCSKWPVAVHVLQPRCACSLVVSSAVTSPLFHCAVVVQRAIMDSSDK